MSKNEVQSADRGEEGRDPNFDNDRRLREYALTRASMKDTRERKRKGAGREDEKRERERKSELVDERGRRGKSLNGIPSGPSNATQR